MKIKIPLWAFFGGLIAVAIGLVLVLIGINQTANKINDKGNPGENPINTLEIVGSVLIYSGGTISSVGIIWLIIALIANAARGN